MRTQVRLLGSSTALQELNLSGTYQLDLAPGVFEVLRAPALRVLRLRHSVLGCDRGLAAIAACYGASLRELDVSDNGGRWAGGGAPVGGAVPAGSEGGGGDGLCICLSLRLSSLLLSATPCAD